MACQGKILINFKQKTPYEVLLILNMNDNCKSQWGFTVVVSVKGNAEITSRHIAKNFLRIPILVGPPPVLLVNVPSGFLWWII